MNKKMLEKYKFVNRDIPIDCSSNITNEFNDLKECLESEGVNLSSEDIVKMFDVYLRLIGIGVHPKDTEIQSISSQCYPIRFDTSNEKYLDQVDIVKKAISGLNDLCSIFEEESLNMILNNIQIIIKEYSIFWNDIISYAVEIMENNKTPGNIYTLEINLHDITKVLKISTIKESTIGISVSILSTVVSQNIPDGISVIVDTYPENIQKILLENNKEEK